MMNCFLKWMKITTLSLVVCGALSGFAWGVSEAQNVQTLVSKAQQYSRQKNKSQLAISYINKAIKLQPRNQQLYYQRALILGRAGMYSAAIPELSRFARMKEFPHAIRFRADCFMAMNDMRSATRDYFAFLRKEPKDGKVWFYLAEAYVLMGDKKSALAAINKGLATGSHWSKKLKNLRIQILTNQIVKPHKPFSN